MADATAVDAALTAQRLHVFADTSTCQCGYGPETAPDWNRHRMDVALDAVADWLAGHTSPALHGDPFVLAADWASGLLRDTVAAGPRLDGDGLTQLSTVVSHCGQPMRFPYRRISWQGLLGSGSEHTEAMRQCVVCPATLTMTLIEPS